MSQKNEPFESPELSEVRGMTRQHIAAMEASDSEEVWKSAGMHNLLLQTVGRKSGQKRKAALPYWNDAQGRPIVVASYRGAPNHPLWYLNLEDTKRNPEVLCRTRLGSFWARAEILDGEEYAQVWDALTADRAYYLDYQKECERRIPLVRLVHLRAA